MEYLHTVIMAIALFALAGCGGSKQTGLPATRKAPTFATAAANGYVKDLSQTANDYVDAIKAKDVRKIKVLTPKLTEIMRTRQTVVNGLKPDEAGKLLAWSYVIMRQIQDAATAAAPPASVPNAKGQ